MKKTIFCSLLSMLLTTVVLASPTIEELLTQGQHFFQQRDYAQAIKSWEMALPSLSDPATQIDVRVRLATAYQAMGNYTRAHATLTQALASASEQKVGVEQLIMLHSHLSDVLLAMQKPEEAQLQIEKGFTLIKPLEKPLLRAHLLNNAGNIFSVQKDYTQALQAYQEAGTLAEHHGDKTLYIQALTNQARIRLKQDDVQATTTLLATALTQIHENPDDISKGFQLMSLGQLALQIQERFPYQNLFQHIYQILDKALQLSEKYKNKRLQAYAKGYLGQLYEQAHLYKEALQLTSQAIFLSQESLDILYLWEWQRGRILSTQGDLQGATAAFERALSYLQPIRSMLTVGQRDAQEIFRERIHPVYFGLADILLQRAALSHSAEEKQPLLIKARNTIELLKAAELQDYFQDECVVASEVKKLDRLDEHTAVLYPILLPSRAELLLTLADGNIHQVIVPIEAATLTETIVAFQANLQSRTTWNFFKQSNQLYRWLIAPIEDKLRSQENLDTLVIVPDGPLRMIPMAALHDGNQFLIERFAIAITPGLSLTEPRPLPKERMLALLQGLSEGVQNFSPLPEVPREIDNISKVLDEDTVLLDKDFTLEHVNQVLQKTPYSIVHIASHGQFDRDPKKTFLLAYDDKITMNRLERLLSFSQLRKEPVELLTLSACQTAVGDERAALGLAGVALKAGARSALASLWFVNDEATSLLITEFYKQLKQNNVSRAGALQNAQKMLISQRGFQHPAYWAPFLLIGNWL
ncbi:MAG: hypothetical protein BWK78_00880 [Thiotrichaceae bacterium IS1]|nr:MAG: hypothetical protein BWK78_00880 [Thiotrichaceae bacterium IS1]